MEASVLQDSVVIEGEEHTSQARHLRDSTGPRARAAISSAALSKLRREACSSISPAGIEKCAGASAAKEGSGRSFCSIYFANLSTSVVMLDATALRVVILPVYVWSRSGKEQRPRIVTVNWTKSSDGLY